MNNSATLADQYANNLFSNNTHEEKVKSPEEKRLEALADTPAVRCEFTRDVSIEVDSYRVGVEFIGSLIERASRSKKPGGFWLLGEGGQGKSFILNRVYQDYPPVDVGERRVCPVVSLTFSSKPKLTAFYLSILMQLGQDPTLISYRDTDELEDIVVDAVAECKTVAALFDEAQHLWLKASGQKYSVDRHGGVLGDTLKRLYDRTGLAFIFSGTPGLEELLSIDLQASTRWAGKHKLTPFSDDNKFAGLLWALDQALPMQERSDLETIYRAPLFIACRQNFRVLKNILAEAVFIAATEGATKLNGKHLARAYFLVTCATDDPFRAG